jgi:carboxylesterase
MNPELHNPELEGDRFLWGSGPWGVLLFHGFTATTSEVRLLGKRLFEAGYTVSGPLLPGHGTKPEDLNRVSWTKWVEFGEQAYIELASRCRGVVIGGESMGALIALAVAARQPSVRGILLFAPALRIWVNTFNQLRLRLIAPFVTGIPKGKLDEAGKWQGYKINPIRGVLELLKLQKEVEKQLIRISQPILIFQGRLDTTIKPESGELILRKVLSEKKQLVWMERSPHVIILSNELDEVTKRSIDFIQSVIY